MERVRDTKLSVPVKTYSLLKRFVANDRKNRTSSTSGNRHSNGTTNIKETFLCSAQSSELKNAQK